MKRVLAAVLALLSSAAAIADVPVRREETVWSLLSYNGRDYSPTFVPESSDSLYLAAGAPSFLSARKTLVYWWPATAEWRTDAESLNFQFDGELELRDSRGNATRLKAQDYTYFNVKGDYEFNWKVATGEAAKAEMDRYTALYDSYFKAQREFQKQSMAFDEEMRSLGEEIARLRKEGKDFAARLKRMQTLPKPEAPPVPAYYEVPPAGIQQAFILDLPPGEYRIKFVVPGGSTMEGTEKKVIVHAPTRRGGIGYSVMPSDKWTYPFESTTPSSVLYVNGKAELYLKPYFEDEYNDLAQAKTVDNGARGNPNVLRWVQIQQVPRASLALRRAGSAEELLDEAPFFVEQTRGSSLGYLIHPWDPIAYKDSEANLIAFRIALDPKDRELAFSLRDGEGSALKGSERSIRIVGASSLGAFLPLLSLLPLLVLLGVTIHRRRAVEADRPAKD